MGDIARMRLLVLALGLYDRDLGGICTIFGNLNMGVCFA